MAAMSDYLEAAILNHTLRNVPLAAPVAVYVALFLDDPTDAGTGTEVTGLSYTRVAATFLAPVDGQIENNADITFPIAGSDWGNVTHLGIYDNLVGGNLYYHGAFFVSKNVLTGDQFIIRDGDLDLQIT